MPRRKASAEPVWPNTGNGSAARANTTNRLSTERRPVGAGIERPGRALDGVAMRGERRGVEVALRCGLEVEVAVAIRAAHQRCAGAHLELADMGRNVTDGKADAAVAGRVGTRAMHQQHVMQ